MGGLCCTSDATGVAEAGSRAKRSGIPQVLLLGLDGSGKTTLLYRTYFSQWHDITSHMEPTVGFHYEEVNKLGMQLGMWDLPGSDSVRQLWPIFYRWIEVTAVVMVVSLTDTRPERIAEVRRLIRVLVNEDELRAAQFAVVLNTFGAEGTVGMADPGKMTQNLGLHDQAVAHKGISSYIVNVKDADRDAEWQRCLFNIVQHIRKQQQQQNASSSPSNNKKSPPSSPEKSPSGEKSSASSTGPIAKRQAKRRAKKKAAAANPNKSKDTGVASKDTTASL